MVAYFDVTVVISASLPINQDSCFPSPLDGCTRTRNEETVFTLMMNVSYTGTNKGGGFEASKLFLGEPNRVLSGYEKCIYDDIAKCMITQSVSIGMETPKVVGNYVQLKLYYQQMYAKVWL